jgi:outer membrane receptor protein involved in Fe transport
VGGLHYLNNLLNKTCSIEPRAGLKWNFTPTQSLSLGFGIHSRMETLPTFFVETEDEDGQIHQPNLKLDFPKSRQYVIGYQNYFTPNLMLKLEAYYQDLYNIAIENDPSSSFSMLNTVMWYTTRQLVNQGTGYNYGLELTLERYFADTYYFMLTGSVYKSKYAAMDKVIRNTRFNGNYVGNVLFGKEFIFSNKPGKSKILSINAKVSLIGARRFSPINLEESREYGYTRVDESRAFTLKGDDIFIVNLGIAYRINKRKTSQEIKLDIQNLTNSDGIVDQYYNSATDEIEYVHQLGMLPNIMYTIEF